MGLYTTFILLTASALAAKAAAVPTAEATFIDGKMAPHVYAAMDITDGIPQGSPLNITAPLQARKDIRYCLRDPARAGVCIALTSAAVDAIGLLLGTRIKNDSDNHDCQSHSGSIDDVTWSTYATGTGCGTTAQVETIRGAIDKYLRDQKQSVCGVHCLKLSHGGTWTGYVTLAPGGEDLDTYYCGAAGSFGQCGSGGGSDAHS